MTLEEYYQKRDFRKTPEPVASPGKSKEIPAGGRIFVVQEHDSTHLHYDLRLEIGGVLRSWALPKEPPLEEGVKRLAIPTEDHPLEYADFEGTIPEGHYGAGTVKTWDRGGYEPLEMGEDRLVVGLQGRKLQGRYALIRTKFRGKDSWLFFRTKS